MDDRTTAGSPVLLDPEHTDNLLRRFSVPTVPQRVVYSPEPEDAVRAAEEFGYPVVLKAFTPTLVHKSDVGGVRMFLHDDHQVSRAATSIRERVPNLVGYLLQSQAPGGHEVIIECSRAAGFGPVIQVGLGGGWAELMGDVSVRIAPIEHQAAREMIDELRGAPLLHGYHGARAADFDALVEMLVNVSRLVVETPEVTKLDLNPAIAGAHEVVAVDARVFWDASRISSDMSLGMPDQETVVTVRSLLSPGSIAVIGSMTGADSPARHLLEALQAQGFAGDVYPVGSGTDEVLGLHAFPGLSDLPAVPDLACIAVAPEDVADAVRACGELGVRAAIVYAALDDELVADLSDAIRETGVRVCGPASAGFANLPLGVNAVVPPAPASIETPAGEIAILTQSATLGSWLTGQSLESGAGLSHWVHTGRELDLTLSDYLQCLVDGADTRVLAIYLETLHVPAAFMRAAGQARASGKPVLVYKPAVFDAGRQPARDDRAVNAAFREAGVARVPDLQSLIDAATALAWQPVPVGGSVGVVSTSGGACSVIADECGRLGLALPELEDETLERIREIDAPIDVVRNPMDTGSAVLRSPGVIGELADTFLHDSSVDSLLLVLSSLSGLPEQELVREVNRVARRVGKPVLIARTGADTLTPEARAPYHAARLPLYPTPPRAIRALSTMVEIGRGRDRAG